MNSYNMLLRLLNLERCRLFEIQCTRQYIQLKGSRSVTSSIPVYMYLQHNVVKYYTLPKKLWICFVWELFRLIRNTCIVMQYFIIAHKYPYEMLTNPLVILKPISRLKYSSMIMNVKKTKNVGQYSC